MDTNKELIRRTIKKTINQPNQLKQDKTMINERTERHINKIVKLNSLVDARDQQIVDLKEEVESLKEEAALLRKYEAVAQKQLEKAKAKEKTIRLSLIDNGHRIVEAKDLCWRLYDGLLTEEDITEDMKTDLRIIIDLLHD